MLQCTENILAAMKVGTSSYTRQCCTPMYVRTTNHIMYTNC